MKNPYLDSGKLESDFLGHVEPPYTLTPPHETSELQLRRAGVIRSRDWLERDWWPLCAVCGKVVDKLEPVPLPENADKYQRAVRRYIVACHGDTEESFVGIWAAHEIASKRKRLPDAFKRLRE